MNAWSHLPNTQYIDRVIKSVKTHPKIWVAALDTAGAAAKTAAWNAARSAARSANRNATGDVTWDKVRNAAWVTARVAARDAVLALIAYDDSAKYLELTSDQLRIWAILSEDPSAILLLPAVIAFEKIDELECV